MIKEKNGFCYNKYSHLYTEEKYIYFDKILYFLRWLTIEYPSFINWYKKLFTTNRSLKSEREILICEKNGEIAGISILKKTREEKKICTLRVKNKYQRNGIGKLLIEYSLEWLGNDKPLITIHKSKQRQFDRLFRYYGFKLEQKNWSYYNIFSTELAYNGILPQQSIFFNTIELFNINRIVEECIKSEYSNVDEIIFKCLNIWFEKEMELSNRMSRSKLYNEIY